MLPHHSNKKETTTTPPLSSSINAKVFDMSSHYKKATSPAPNCATVPPSLYIIHKLFLA